MLFFVSSAFSQNETNYWYFGNNAGLNFSNGDFAVPNDGSMQTPAGCSSISDRDGNLLFYTNGQTVWNKNHQIMQNGTDLSGDINGVQTSIIIPKPGDISTYYIFYVRRFTQSLPIYLLSGVYYSEVKFDTQNPLGYITDNKDIRFIETTEATSRLAAIHHPESNSIRVICMTKPDPVFGAPPIPDDKFVFRVINVTQNGVSTPIIRDINEGLGRIGAMKISPNGEYLAFADNLPNTENGKIFFYKYNNDTIEFEFEFYRNTIPTINMFLHPYGIEFSQDSRILYYTGGNYVVQIPFLDMGGAQPVGYYIMGPSPGANSLQLARNGKIYVAHGDANNSINAVSVINQPEKIGEACEYNSLSVALTPGSSFQGLPIFIATPLRNRILPVESDCEDTTFSFELDAYVPITSVLWDFGDGTTSTSLTPTHQFSEPGIHKVSATIMVDNYPVTLYRDVEAYPLPSLDPNQTLQQCDVDNNPTSVFNLENIGDKMNNPNPEYEYVFYHTMNDAQNDINPIPNQLAYQNQTNPEEIFVKITSPFGCVSISSFFIETSYTELGQISPVYACGNSDNEATFNIDFKIDEIRQELNIPQNFSIIIYPSFQDAQTKLDPLDRYYTTSTTTVWIRIEDENNDCNGIGSFQLIVNQGFELNIEDSYVICDTNLQPLTVLDGGANNDIWEWRNSSGTIISTSRNFILTQEGTFSLTVYRTQNGIQCSSQKQFVVTQSGEVQFNQISTDNNEIYVSVIGNSTYEFSLDGNNFYGHGNSYTFTGISTGFHIVYVKDVYNCETPISQEIFLLNFPHFFTPNGDGVNDYWRINSLVTRIFPKVEIVIYDRYGKMIKYMDFPKDAFGWDGTYKGEKLPATDYWFKATLKDNTGNTLEKKGHFSLMR